MHIAVVGGDPRNLLRFRGDLMRRMQARGHRVTAVSGGRDGDVASALAADEIAYESFPLDRTGIGPKTELTSVWKLAQILRRVRPDLVIAYTPKVIVYASAAARLARVRRVCALMTGLGTAFTDTGAARRNVNRVVRGLLAAALRGVDLVVFQNDDDRQELLRRRVLPRSKRTARINGSGVDTSVFKRTEPPAPPVAFLLIARLQREKGIYEFAEAAAKLRKEFPDARCILVGPIDSHPAAIDRADLDRWCEDGIVEWKGPADDVRPHLNDCHVFVLPSYREGTPRAVLEAMSVGRPIITTDVPGCRETVTDGDNGLLVPARESAGLTTAMLKLAGDANARAAMGAASRSMAEERFEVSKVSARLIDLLEELSANPRR